jgi:zinc D-Ala-D-Ala carboxypeptidase
MISQHLSESEFLHTGTGLPNAPERTFRYGRMVDPVTIRANAVRLAETLLDPLSEKFAGWGVTSWYRSPAVNAAKHGMPNSAHLVGLAADGHPLHGTFAEAIAFLDAEKLPFDKVIYEVRGDSSRWLHVQAAEDGAKPARVFYSSPFGGVYVKKTAAELADLAVGPA